MLLFCGGGGKGNLFLFSNFSDNGVTKTQTEPAQRKPRNSLFGLRVGNHRLAFRCRQCSGSRVLPPAGHASPGSTPGSSRRWQPGPPACARSLLTASRPGRSKASCWRPRHPRPQAPPTTKWLSANHWQVHVRGCCGVTSRHRPRK